MRRIFSRPACLLLLSVGLLYSCEPSVKLTASWSNKNAYPTAFYRVLVVSFGTDLGKRRLGEDHIRAELQRHGLVAVSSLDQFGPNFTEIDSIKMRGILLDNHFDGVVTIRVLKIDEQDRWEPGIRVLGPVEVYQGYYGYYYRMGRYYRGGYTVTDVEVLLESNLYRVTNGELLWSGQSRAFSKDPTEAMADRYARNIVEDMIRKHVILPTLKN